MLLLSSADFFKIYFFSKKIQEHFQSVKQFGPKLGPTSSGSKLFAKFISYPQMLLLARKELKHYVSWCAFSSNAAIFDELDLL